MKALLALVLLFCTTAFAADESITVTVVGKLRTGIVAIGGETTGTTITSKGVTWELDLGNKGEFREAAEKFNGQTVIVQGSLERRAGVEIKERWIVKVSGLQAAGDAGVGSVGSNMQPAFSATARRTDTRIRFELGDERTIVDVTSAFGIDRATIRRESSEWPKKILVRLHLRGLESFQAGGEQVTVEWAVSSTGEHEPSAALISGKRVAAITPESPYYTAIVIVGNEPKIPLEDGFFEIPLPAKLFAGNPQEITLSWIDFYRN